MKNGKAPSVESRLARLEDEIRQLRALLDNGAPKAGWPAIVGTLAGDPVFDEIRKVTMELIEKDRRRARRARRGVAKTRR